MVQNKKTFSEIISDGLKYLTNNTPLTYYGDGSIIRALVETFALEIVRLQDFSAVHSENRFLSRATGVFLDLFGEMMGLPRIVQSRAGVTAEDESIRFYVKSGSLGSRLPDTDPANGVIPAGTTISSIDGSVQFVTPTPTIFPKGDKSVYVPAIATTPGSSSNVGANQLTQHNLVNTDIFVTNDFSVVVGTDLEPDDTYRFRLSRQMTAKSSANATAIQVAASTAKGVSRAELVEYARGAGTYDVLLIPQGNRVTLSTMRDTLSNLETVTAFGISPRIREPNYIPVGTSIQLQFIPGLDIGRQALLKERVQQAILTFFAQIPLGGTLVINQLRAAVINVSTDIQDLNILELCIDRKPRTLRNYNLKSDELFIIDDQNPDPIEIV